LKLKELGLNPEELGRIAKVANRRERPYFLPAAPLAAWQAGNGRDFEPGKARETGWATESGSRSRVAGKLLPAVRLLSPGVPPPTVPQTDRRRRNTMYALDGARLDGARMALDYSALWFQRHDQ
jgi:hypothetical protein